MTIHTILINSSSKIAGTTTTNAFYNMDWSVLPSDKHFKVGFALATDTVNITSHTSIALVSVVIGGVNCYRTSSSTSYTPISNLIGFITPPVLSTTTYLLAEASANNRVWLQTRPKNNVFQVAITANTGGFWLDNVGATINAYTLILSFEEVDII